MHNKILEQDKFRGFIKGKLTISNHKFDLMLSTPQQTFLIEDHIQVTYPAQVHYPFAQLFKISTCMKPL